MQGSNFHYEVFKLKRIIEQNGTMVLRNHKIIIFESGHKQIKEDFKKIFQI